MVSKFSSRSLSRRASWRELNFLARSEKERETMPSWDSWGSHSRRTCRRSSSASRRRARRLSSWAATTSERASARSYSSAPTASARRDSASRRRLFEVRPTSVSAPARPSRFRIRAARFFPCRRLPRQGEARHLDRRPRGPTRIRLFFFLPAFDAHSPSSTSPPPPHAPPPEPHGPPTPPPPPHDDALPSYDAPRGHPPLDDDRPPWL